MSIEMSFKDASPLTADTVKVPDNVPLLGLLFIARVIESVAVVTRLPPASCTWTLMAGDTEAVETVLLGSRLYTSCVAAPTVMSKLADVARLNPKAVASTVYPVPTLSIEISLKVATPLTADTVKVPDNVPLLGLLLMAKVMESVAVVTRLPPASCT